MIALTPGCSDSGTSLSNVRRLFKEKPKKVARNNYRTYFACELFVKTYQAISLVENVSFKKYKNVSQYKHNKENHHQGKTILI